MSRRYLNLPSWDELLRIFASHLSNDPYSYEFYRQQAQSMDHPAGLLPTVASLIQADFDKKWFSDPSFRSCEESYRSQIQNGASPFKAEIASYLARNSIQQTQFSNEIDAFCDLTQKSISGIITTNYDLFLEAAAKDYQKYIGQTELVFSPIQGIAEIYKIHGCITDASSIVINEADYLYFDQHCSYLAAKLMTLFMEYPIIFMGYSISDRNILKILQSIADCLPSSKLEQLKSRFIFVEYNPDATSIVIQTHEISFGEKRIPMTKVILSDFCPLYSALTERKNTIPVKVLRTFKQEFYDFTLTSTPTARLKVGDIDDDNIQDSDLALAFGKISDFGLLGLKGITGNDWYRNIILRDITRYSCDELLTYAYPHLRKSNTGIPVHMCLSEATQSHPECEEQAAKETFDSFLNSSIRNNRHTCPFRDVSSIIDKYSCDPVKVTRLLSYLTEDEIDVTLLYNYLHKLFTDNPDILSQNDRGLPTNIRRLIRIYDYLKFHKK